MPTYKIIGRELRRRNIKFQTADRKRAESRCDELRKSVDPGARVVTIVASR